MFSPKYPDRNNKYLKNDLFKGLLDLPMYHRKKNDTEAMDLLSSNHCNYIVREKQYDGELRQSFLFYMTFL